MKYFGSMQRGIVLTFLAALPWCASVNAQAIPPAGIAEYYQPKARGGAPVEFRAASSLPSGSVSPSVIGGRLARSEQWTATFISNDSCTSTAIGPQVLLTAAHCVDHGGQVLIRTPGGINSGVCAHHPKYSASATEWDRTSADYALCKLEQPIDASRYETVAIAPIFQAGNRIILLGFGCDTVTKEAGFGQLRIGDARIVSLPAGANNYFMADWRDTDLGPVVGASLCPGDSGGSAYWVSDPNLTNRRIVAVNSRVSVDRITRNVTGQSYLSSTSTADATSFLLNWSAANSVGICGVTAGTQKCHP